MGDLAPMHEWRFYIEIPPDTIARLCAGIESITENVNSQNKQYFFLCQKGTAVNSVNGIAPQYTVSGRRVYGDEAQEYIAGLKYKFGKERETVFHMEREVLNRATGNTVITQIEGLCTIMDISDIGGSTTDNVPFSFTIAFNGKPSMQTIIVPPIPDVP